MGQTKQQMIGETDKENFIIGKIKEEGIKSYLINFLETSQHQLEKRGYVPTLEVLIEQLKGETKSCAVASCEKPATHEWQIAEETGDYPRAMIFCGRHFDLIKKHKNDN